MSRLLISCLVALLAYGNAESVDATQCTADSELEECMVRKVDLLQAKVQLDAAGQSSVALDVGKVEGTVQMELDAAGQNSAKRTSDDYSCRAWCAGRVDAGVRTWDEICGWTNCGACDQCTTATTTTTTTTSWQSPYFAMSCHGIDTTPSMTYEQYDNVTARVQQMYNDLPTTCNATYCPQADWAGCVLRIAGHDFMDYEETTSGEDEGGSDGCIDFHDGDNAGLAECIHTGEFGFSLDDAYTEFCYTISLADFFVIAAEAVMDISRKHVTDEDSNRSAMDFRSAFRFGRTTAKSCEFAEGRLPNPENSCTDVEESFVTRMGLSWEQSAALSAVHTLGRAHIDNSGYNGWWSDVINSRKFNNDYFVSMVAKGWGPEVSVNGNPNKNQWKRTDMGVNETTLGKEMMLNSDMCLYYTMDDAGAVQMDAATAEASNCTCAWPALVRVQDAVANYNNDYFCGSTTHYGASNFPRQRAVCCGEEFNTINDAYIDCGLPISPQGPANTAVRKFANDETKWIDKFMTAWRKATTNGFSGQLRQLQTSS